MRARAATGAGVLALLVGGLAGCAEDGVRRADSPSDSRPTSPAGSPPTAGEPPARPSNPGRSDRADPSTNGLRDEPVRPASPRQAAAQLAAAHRAIQDPSTPAGVLTAAGHTQQVAYRELADRPAWDERVAALLPRPLRRDAADNVAARRAFRSMHPDSPADLASELPAWRIVAPPPAQRLRRHYLDAERRYGIDWEYLAAIHLVETGFGRIRGTSVAGAQGPMQFIPTTWDIYGAGGDIQDPHDAILAAGRLLRANGFARDRSAALYRYNNSEAYVRGVTLYAEVMQRTPRAFLGYHQWQIYYLTRHGSILLPEGYAERRPVPVREWLAQRDQSTP